MLTRKKSIDILRQKAPYLNERFGVKRIALFGSFAKSRQSKDSDLDLVVEFDRPIGLTFFDLVEYLEKVLNKKVDILTFEAIKTIRIKHIAESIKRSLIYV